MLPPDVANVLVAGTYRLNSKLVSGTFGDVYMGINERDGTPLAVKVESIKKHPLRKLQIEYNAYSRLEHEKGLPTIYYFGQHESMFTVLVMQLLDYNLEQLFFMCHKTFSLKTILYVMIELLTRIETIHRNGIIYRDVKPENFMIGKKQDKNTIYVIDFGFSKSYVDPVTGEHIKNEMRRNADAIGSVRYMSLNVHQGNEHSRRDDLESLGYLMIYYLKRAKLPWSGMTRYCDKQRYEKIFQHKIFTSIEKLCHGHPPEFAGYLRYVRSLEFDEEPCYQYLQGLFVGRFQNDAYPDDGQYDWSNKLI